MSKNQTIRLLFSIALVPVGSLMIVLHSADSRAGELLSHVGFAFVVAGVLSTFHEAVLHRFEQEESEEKVAEAVSRRMTTASFSATGIRLVSPIRWGYTGYYQWVVSTAAEEMFFAGRSVLHRVHADFRSRGIGNAEALIARRLSEGAKIKVLFLDPRSNLISRLAKEEGQTERRLLSDLAISLGICERLYMLLEGKPITTNARLDICVFDEIPYFAYHSVGETVVVGFYFSSALGHQSAAYEVVDVKTREFFAEHFRSIMARASDKYIVRINPHSGRIEKNQSLVDELRKAIGAVVGDEQVTQLMAGNAT